MLPYALVALLLQSPASDARQVTLSAIHIVTEVDASKLKGDLVRLAWSPDGRQFYLQTIERDSHGNVKQTRHYIVSTAPAGTGRGLSDPAGQVKSTEGEPEWASKYWTWKSGQASPAAAAFKIDVSSRQETKRSTAAPVGGALAKGGGADPAAGTTLQDVASAADTTQVQTIYSLKVKGETIGEWINEAVVPGVNFAWAPAPNTLLVFAKREGGPLTVLDASGRKQELTGAKAALLPAWSTDATKLAWLERKDRKKYDLKIAEITPR
jgi:hypothetical protein